MCFSLIYKLCLRKISDILLKLCNIKCCKTALKTTENDCQIPKSMRCLLHDKYSSSFKLKQNSTKRT